MPARNESEAGNLIMERVDIKMALLEIAEKCFKQGQGWSMGSIVLQDFVEKYPHMKGDLKREQTVLQCWQELFSDKILCPGWGLDNPRDHWFHIIDRS